MATKKSYKNDLIRGATLALAVLIFFAGPYLQQNETAEDSAKLVFKVSREKKIPLALRLEVIEQLQSDAKYIRENANTISVMGVTTSAINWLALVVILVGFGLPIVTKYFDNKKAAP